MSTWPIPEKLVGDLAWCAEEETYALGLRTVELSHADAKALLKVVTAHGVLLLSMKQRVEFSGTPHEARAELSRQLEGIKP
jgi:hypothetical protein